MSSARQQDEFVRSSCEAVWSNCCLYLQRQNRQRPTKNMITLNEEDKLRAKFLEGLAWVMATKAGAEYVSAACFERNSDATGSYRIRVTRNRGLDDSDLEAIRRLLQKVRDVANHDVSREEKLRTVLVEVITLKREKLIYYAERILRQVRDLDKFQDLGVIVEEFETTLRGKQDGGGLAQSIERLKELADSESYWSAGEFSVEQILKLQNNTKKLARCSDAARVLLECAECPATSGDISIIRKANRCPPSCRDPNAVPLDIESLDETLSRSSMSDSWNQLRNTVGAWLGDVRKTYQESLDGAFVHAEMQLIGYYDYNPPLLMSPKYIGISKLACFVCQKMLLSCEVQNKGCHQKVYHKWWPPAFSSLRSVHVERWISYLQDVTSDNLREIEGTLGHVQKNLPRIAIQSYAESVASGISAQVIAPVMKRTSRMVTDLRRVALVGQGAGLGGISVQDDRRGAKAQPVSRGGNTCPNKYQDVVLLIYRLREPWKRDVLRIEDFLLPNQNGDYGLPDWDMLLERINSSGSGALGDDDVNLKYDSKKEVLVLGRSVVLRNERQLLPALDYFVNAGERNIHAVVCNKLELRYLGEDRLRCL